MVSSSSSARNNPKSPDHVPSFDHHHNLNADPSSLAPPPPLLSDVSRQTKQAHFAEAAAVDVAGAPFLSPPPPTTRHPSDRQPPPPPLAYCFRSSSSSHHQHHHQQTSISHQQTSIGYHLSSRLLGSSPTAENAFPHLQLFNPPPPHPYYPQQQQRPPPLDGHHQHHPGGEVAVEGGGGAQDDEEEDGSPGGATCGSCFGGRSNRSAGSSGVKTPRTAKARLPFLASTANSSAANSPSSLQQHRMQLPTTANGGSATTSAVTRSAAHRLPVHGAYTNGSTNPTTHNQPYYTPHNRINNNSTQQLYRSFGLRSFCFPSSPMQQASPLFCNLHNVNQQPQQPQQPPQMNPSFFPTASPSFRPTTAEPSLLPLAFPPQPSTTTFIHSHPPSSNLCFESTRDHAPPPPPRSIFSIFPSTSFTAAVAAPAGGSSIPVVSSSPPPTPPPASSLPPSSSPLLTSNNASRSPPMSPSDVGTIPSSSSVPSSPSPPPPRFPPAQCPPLPLLSLPPPRSSQELQPQHLRPSIRRVAAHSPPPSVTAAETATTETAEPSPVGGGGTAGGGGRFPPPLPPSNKTQNTAPKEFLPLPAPSLSSSAPAPPPAASAGREIASSFTTTQTEEESSNDEYDLQFGGVQIRLHKKLSAKCHCQFDVWEAEATSYVDYQETRMTMADDNDGKAVSPVSAMLQGRCKMAVAQRESLVQTHKRLQAVSAGGAGNGGRFALKLLDMDTCDPAKLKYKTHSVIAEGRQLNDLCRQMWSSETQTYIFGGDTMHMSTASSSGDNNETKRGNHINSGSSNSSTDDNGGSSSTSEAGGDIHSNTSPYSSTSSSPSSSPNASPTPTVSTTASAGGPAINGSSSSAMLETVANKQLSTSIVALRSSAARPCRTPPNLMPIPRYLWTADGTRKKDGQRVLGVAMEMIQGRSLTHLLQQLRCPMKPSAALLALEISVKIVESQRVLAEKLHRPLINWDTKPGNIILELSRSSSGRLHCRRAVIVDLGDALPGPSFWFPTRQRPGDTPGYIICTKGYCSPECALLVFLLASSSRCAAFRKVWYSDKVTIEQLQQTRKLRIPHRWKHWIKHGYLKRTPTITTTSNNDGSTSSTSNPSASGINNVCSVGSTTGPANYPSVPGTPTGIATAPPPPSSSQRHQSTPPSSSPPPMPVAAADPSASSSTSNRDRGCWEILFTEKSVVFSTGLVLAQIFGGPNLLQVVEKDEVRALDLLCEWGFKGTTNLFSGLPNLSAEDLLPTAGVFAEERWRSRLLVLLEGCLAFLPANRWSFKQVGEYLQEFYQDYFNAYQQAKVKALLAAQQKPVEQGQVVR
eukprot:GHVS01088866.1.p1 GENE.GHVS01088866.1~~GHVS01088866.1.p1  ORF type:complete len:1318 (+),score=402.23 GHVS01088866.1:672-4625(+)